MQFNHYDSTRVEMYDYSSAEQLSICNYGNIIATESVNFVGLCADHSTEWTRP